MCQNVLHDLVDEYPFHFLVNSEDGILVGKISKLNLHEIIVQIDHNQYLVFFKNDLAMNRCLSKVEHLIHTLDPHRFNVL